jgi:hypothetical protein
MLLSFYISNRMQQTQPKKGTALQHSPKGQIFCFNLENLKTNFF